MSTAEECAALLLETVPFSMRLLAGTMQQARGSDSPQLNFGQLRMLEMLHHRAWTLSDLAERHHVAASTMSRTMDVLVKRDWVERRSHPEDRRQVLLTLTGDGLEALVEMRRSAAETITQLIERLSDGERERLYGGLQVLQKLTLRMVEQNQLCAPGQQPAAEQSGPGERVSPDGPAAAEPQEESIE